MISIPRHIAIIMDGNGRWAQAKGLPRTEGHRQGAKMVERVLRHAHRRGVEVVTLYAFSSENWNRPKEEVDTLIGLFRNYLNNDVERFKKEGVRISFIGDRYRFPTDIWQKMDALERETAGFDKGRVVLALSYGARDDLTMAMRTIAKRVAAGTLNPDDISADTITASLSTAGIPDPDLVIRTSGEERVSNFLLWELAYAEFYWTSVLWPDFDETELDQAIEAFSHRHRRFGKV